MLRFAKVFETAGQQVLVRLSDFPKPSTGEVKPVLMISTRVVLPGLEHYNDLILVALLDSQEQGPEVLERFGAEHARRALEMLLSLQHQLITPKEHNDLLQELKRDLLILN